MRHEKKRSLRDEAAWQAYLRGSLAAQRLLVLAPEARVGVFALDQTVEHLPISRHAPAARQRDAGCATAQPAYKLGPTLFYCIFWSERMGDVEGAMERGRERASEGDEYATERAR